MFYGFGLIPPLRSCFRAACARVKFGAVSAPHGVVVYVVNGQIPFAQMIHDEQKAVSLNNYVVFICDHKGAYSMLPICYAPQFMSGLCER